jgi:hypothetical protein
LLSFSLLIVMMYLCDGISGEFRVVVIEGLSGMIRLMGREGNKGKKGATRREGEVGVFKRGIIF